MFAKLTKVTMLCAIVMLVAACDQSVTPPTQNSGLVSQVTTGDVTKQGEDTNKEQTIQETINVNNCGNPSPREEEVQEVQSISHAVNWQFRGQSGADFKVEPFGVGVDIKALLESAYGNDANQLMCYGHIQHLPVEANSNIDYTIEWKPIWWKGQIPVGYGSDKDFIYFQYQAIRQFSHMGAIVNHPERCSGSSGQVAPPPVVQEATQVPVQPQTSLCPSVEQAQAAIGLNLTFIGSGSSDCAWHSDDRSYAKCPSGWACTMDVSGSIFLYKGGDGVGSSTRGGTFRYMPAYPQNDRWQDICRLLAFEDDYGLAKNPPYRTNAANFSCSK